MICRLKIGDSFMLAVLGSDAMKRNYGGALPLTIEGLHKKIIPAHLLSQNSFSARGSRPSVSKRKTS